MMQRVQPTSSDRTKTEAGIPDAGAIPPLGHAEAGRMTAVEHGRFLDLLDALDGDDWNQPTACTLWTVKDIAAHQAGWVAGTASQSALEQMADPAKLRPYLEKGMTVLDSINQGQVDDRKTASPVDLIAELRANMPRSRRARQAVPGFLRAYRVNLPGLGGVFPLGYLTDLIYTRDMWMHRLDISRATRHVMILDLTHDGRIVALVLRDLAAKLLPVLAGRSVVYDLSGRAGGAWSIGSQTEPAATIHMDALDFCLLASGRLTAQDALDRRLAYVEGKAEISRATLEATSVPF